MDFQSQFLLEALTQEALQQASLQLQAPRLPVLNPARSASVDQADNLALITENIQAVVLRETVAWPMTLVLDITVLVKMVIVTA